MSYNKPYKARVLMAFSWFWPFLAGLFKGFTYTFGALTFLTLITTGSLVVTLPILVSPLLPLAIGLGASVAFISWGMEGLALFKHLFKGLRRLSGINWEPDKSTPSPPSQNVFIKIIKALASLVLYSIGAALPALAALCKGIAATAGTIAILLFILNVTGVIPVIALTAGPVTLAVIVAGIVAGITVGLVCLGKEGYTFFKHLDLFVQKLWGVTPDTKLKQKKHITGSEHQPILRAILTGVGYIIPVLAGLAKSFTYTFGAVNFLNFLMTGTFAVTGIILSSPIFPMACMLGGTLFFISLGMEGRALAKKFYRALFRKCDVISYKQEKQEKQEKGDIKNQSENTTSYPGERGNVQQFFLTLYCYALRAFSIFAAAATSVAKGMSGATGTMATLLFIFDVTGVIPALALSLTSPIGIIVLVCGAVAGITIAGLSASKEGPTFVIKVWEYTNALLGNVKQSIKTAQTYTLMTPVPADYPRYPTAHSSTVYQPPHSQTQPAQSQISFNTVTGQQHSLDQVKSQSVLSV